MAKDRDHEPGDGFRAAFEMISGAGILPHRRNSVKCPVCSAEVKEDQERGGDMNSILFGSEAECQTCWLWDRNFQTGTNFERIGFQTWNWRDDAPPYPYHSDEVITDNERHIEDIYKAAEEEKQYQTREQIRRAEMKLYLDEVKQLWAQASSTNDHGRGLIGACEAAADQDLPFLALADWCQENEFFLTERSLRKLISDRVHARNDPKKDVTLRTEFR